LISPAISNRGTDRNQIRYKSNGLYPPRIALQFRVIGPSGQVIQSGKRDLTDLNYQLRTFYPMDDYLRYEKDLLRHWFIREFSDLKKQ
jgi:hypothetical protein